MFTAALKIVLITEIIGSSQKPLCCCLLLHSTDVYNCAKTCCPKRHELSIFFYMKKGNIQKQTVKPSYEEKGTVKIRNK